MWLLQEVLSAGVALVDGEAPKKMTRKQIDAAVYAAKQKTQELDDAGALGTLTHDMAAAIYIYSMESTFYKIVNKLLRAEDRTLLKPFFPYLRLALTGMRRLPKEDVTVYRGIALPLSKLDDASHYKPGRSIVWWPFSSTTSSKAMLMGQSQFLGKEGDRTLFVIKTATARTIKAYSAFPKENELLVLPGTTFKVTRVETEGGLTTISMEEDTHPAAYKIDTGDDVYDSVSVEPFYENLNALQKGGRKAPPASRPMKSPSGTDVNGPGPGSSSGGPKQKSALVRHVTIASREASRRSVAYIGSVKSQWFMPHLSRMETVDFLKGKRHGSFVIRKSSFRPELEPGASGVSDLNATYYAISMKKRDRELYNGLIIHSIGIFTMVCEDAKEFKYTDLSELVKGLLSNQDLISVAGLPERLLLPSTGKQ